MKILFLTTGLCGSAGGWGRYSAGLIGALSAQGVDCVSITARNEGGDAAFLPSWGAYHENFLLAPFLAWRLRAYAKDCDAIHALVEPYAAVAWWLSRFTGKPYFITAHGTYGVMPFHLAPHLRFIHRISLSGARAVIAVSSYTRDRLMRHGVRNVEVVENGIDLATFWTDAPLPLEKREEYLMTVGALKRRKGQHVSLAAFALLKDSHPTLRYRFFGSGQDERYVAKLRALARKEGIEERVEFFTQEDTPRVVAAYQTAKAHLLTSLSEGPHFEGFGLVYLEAGASGTPSIGAMGSGAEDALKKGEAGMLVPQNDPRATAAALTRLLTERSEWERMSRAAHENAKAHDWGVIAAAYARLYGLL